MWLGCAWGGGVALSLLAVATLAGLAPEGTVAWAWLGGAVAVVIGVLGAALQSRLAAVSAEDPQVSRQFVLSLCAPFGLHVLVAVAGVLILSWSQLKFEAVAAFAFAFVAAVTIVHTASAFAVGRALRQRGRFGMAGYGR